LHRPVSGGRREPLGRLERPSGMKPLTTLLIAFAAVIVLAACSGSEAAPDQPGGSASVPTEKAPAPIEHADVALAGSAPPQYFLQVVTGLPSGCAEFDRYEVERSGDVITVTFWNQVPAADVDIMCTA